MSSDYPSSRIFFNILGGSLTLLATQLPWLDVNGMYPISLQSGGIFTILLYWARAGALLSFLSRFGGLFTFVSMIGLAGEPYVSYRMTTPGIGVLLALGGGIFTLAGVRWAIPPGMARGREILGGVLYTVGFLIILTLVVSSFDYGGLLSIGSTQLVLAAPVLLVGVLLTGLGLKLFLAPEQAERPLEILGRA